MTFIALKPRKALNKAFLKVKPNRTEIDAFKANLIQLLDQINEKESEEFHKNIVSKFLDVTYYSGNHYINTKGRNDLVIHNGKDAKTSVGVIVEAKKPTANKAEMLRVDNLNSKAFQELVLYYLRERITGNNIEIKYVIATNIYEWFIFDAEIFDKAFAQDKEVVKRFIDFEEKRLSGTTTDFFYKEIAEPAVENLLKGDSKAGKNLTYTHFDIRDIDKKLRNKAKDDDTDLIPAYKLFSPEHLLKLPFKNDSNSLDKSFYSELLHIIGLTEVKDGGKKLIDRKEKGSRDEGSFLENTITQLDTLDKISRLERPSAFGSTNEVRFFNVGLELVITWVNRILFLKLLEAQLVSYHKGDKSFAFLNTSRIKNFDDLNSLFFQVLAKQADERSASIKELFSKVPYLNSSLFEPTDLEHNCLFISQLQENKELPILSSTVLKDNNGRKKSGKLNVLQYLFEFLDAYDFSSEGSEDIQEENKTLISASVLGLIFEKINGYKDGSFFTPGFITMYMCRETIRRAIVQKFNDAKGWNCLTIEDVYDKIEDKKEANTIINSLKICDPAVGSGHFLVSALNEIIATKSGLKILLDREGKTLRDYHIEVSNDELAITDDEGKLFEYKPTNKESQRIQETLFHEKQTIIENCLFGVDINPNSVKICRLRLWIELLKNAYYKADSNFTELETLPNIDINIKCGNSLISRFPLDVDLSQALKKSKITIKSYKQAVQNYRHAESKEQKREMEQLIASIKSNFRTEISNNDPKVKRLSNKRGELSNLVDQHSLFPLSKAQQKERKQLEEKLIEEVNKLEAEIEEIKSNKIYESAFEWRFEFPEILNDSGDYVGFDIVIGNPPYIRQEEIKELSGYLQKTYKTFSGKADIYVYFYELGIRLLGVNKFICFITSSKFLEASYGAVLTNYLINELSIEKVINFGDLEVFEGVTAYPLILAGKKAKEENFQVIYYSMTALPESSLEELLDITEYLTTDKMTFIANDFKFVDSHVSNILEKVKQGSISLEEFCGLPIVGIKTGYNDGYLTNIEDSEQIKPYIFGRDIKKYQPVGINNKIIFPYNQDYSIISQDDDKPIFQQLLKNKKKLSERAIIKDGIISGSKCWYEYQQINRTVNYNDEYIVYPNVSLGNNFTFSKGAVIDMTAFLIKSNSRYLLAILNSKLVSFLMKVWAIGRRGGYLEYKVQYVEKIPIKMLSDAEQKPFIDIVNQIIDIKNQDIEKDTLDLENKLDRMVYELYSLTSEDISAIEIY